MKPSTKRPHARLYFIDGEVRMSSSWYAPFPSTPSSLPLLRRLSNHRVKPNHIISYHIISYHIISYHIVSYRIVSNRIVSYRIIIISYHFMISHTTTKENSLFNHLPGAEHPYSSSLRQAGVRFPRLISPKGCFG